MNNHNKISEKTKLQPSVEELLRYFEINAQDLTGEKALWQSVVMQAVLDATSKTTDLKSRIEKAKTTSWFSYNNEDFILVCSFAELDPDFIINGLKRILKKNKKPHHNRYRKKMNMLKKMSAARSKKSLLKQNQTV